MFLAAASVVSLALPAAALSPSAIAATSDQAIGDLPAASPANAAEFRRQADALYRMKEKAFADTDAETIINRFYAKDAVSFGPEGKPIMGRDQFREDYERVVKIANVRVEPIRSHVGADAAWEWANFYVTPKDPAQKPYSFVILFVWAKKDGRWVCGGDAYTPGQFAKTP
ncbi:MAG TPA: nuclear transport factor 2 family protein [Phenylobacterium sp.]|uniref:YybH family protein n=1 Tax=Phenylobacterium sp. TaxID=1871053 RepID=UPI002B4886A5|nr:nuclear transport factor 2 family protein [Phenylobacterium sp.]HKR87605.1 nuclear transport factor 2 family protein [Phenylobacterium sp.]